MNNFENCIMKAINYLVIFVHLFCCLLSIETYSQQIGIMQEQLEYYNSLGNTEASYYEATTEAATKESRNDRSSCNLNKIVYGWHPYWSGNSYQNYDWNLLTHMSFFSYEVNANNGNAINTHGWNTSAAVGAALSAGNVKVTLCVTLFSNHTTFFSSTTSQQTLINNLINLIQTRGAHGVNIDFEGLPNSQKTRFANFMVNLANQMHAAIPGSEVSTVLYAVDWNDVFNFSIMNQAVDHYIIMGYDYYWSGSTTTGPNDPLYQFGNSYNYSLSRSITYYLDKGCPKNKLVLGLPYYGREWRTNSSTVPSSIVSNTGTTRTYSEVKTNTSGLFSTVNHQFDNASHTDIYVFNSNGTRQSFISLDNAFKKRLEHVNNTGIAGIGIWALGYDDGYNQRWDAIEEYMTDCFSSPCSGTIHDFGGTQKNYNNDEDYTWTVAPAGASSLTFNFTSFDTEEDFDLLYIYDGTSTASPQIIGSPFSGTTSPGNFTSTTGAVTFRFISDYSSTRSGFLATYTCSNDVTAPISTITSPGNWKNNDFTANFTDTDNTGGSGVDKRFYQITDYNGIEWRANNTKGFYFDDFNQSTIHSEWISSTGNWSINNNTLHQSDQTNTNTNIYSALNQNNHNQWFHQFSTKINGSGSNRRVGYHFMCDNGSLPNRGNSYFVWLRADNDKIQIYKVNNDVFSLEADIPYTINTNQWYDVKIVYNKTNGKIEMWLDNVYAATWTDPSPLTIGNSISFRSGDATMEVDNFNVYHNRTTSALITLGSSTDELRYQNSSPINPAGKIRSISIDNAKNISAVASENINIDWTTPTNPSNVNDGPGSDISLFNTPSQISGNWTASTDPNSDISEYQYAIGTSPLATDIVNWTSNGNNTTFTANGLSLSLGTTYYISVRAINGAGLVSLDISSNGATLSNTTDLNLSEIDNKSTIQIGPNPFSEKITIYGTSDIITKTINVELFDINGRVVYSKSDIQNQKIITIENLEQLTNGIYYIKIVSEINREILFYDKIIKQ